MPTQSVSVSLGANPAGFIAGLRAAETATLGLDARMAGLSKSMKLLGGVFIADKIVHGLVDAGKAAGDFQAKMTRLQTDANESAKNLGAVSKGILDLAGATGNTTTALADGMYKIESAGVHGADALKVLKAAAEGAKVGAADLTTVADALTTAMTDYHLKSGQATSTTNELIATVSRGKTNLEALSESLSKVAPAAATAHISLAELLGAMATMTAQGTNANNAATYLRQTILQLSNPTAKARTEMQNLGLSAIDVSQHLGDRGLTGTFQILTDAIQRRMGPTGTVFIKQLQDAAKNTTAWQATLANLSAPQQTYVAALADMTGGTKSLQAVLELTGSNAGTFTRNVQEIGASTQGAGAHVKDWDVVQKNFNQRLAEARGQFEKVKIVLGQDLLPLFTQAAKIAADFGMVLGRFPQLTSALVLGLAGAGGLVLALKAVNAATAAFNGLAASSIGWRTRNTAAMVAEGAAARSAASSVAALDVAEAGGGGKVGLLGRLGRSTIGTGIGVAAIDAAPIALPAVAVVGAGAGVAYAISEGRPTGKVTRGRDGRSRNNPTTTADDPGTAQWASTAASDDALSHHAAADYDAEVKGQQAAARAARALVAANGAADTSYHVVTAAMIANSGVMDGTHARMVGLSGSTGDLTTHLGIVAKALQGAKDKTSAFAAGLSVLNGDAVDASRAQDGFQQQLNTLASSFTAHTKTLQGNSEAAIQNRGLVDELVTANNQAAEAVLKHTGSVDKAKAVLVANAKALESNVTAVTGSKKATDDFLKSIGALPSQVEKAFDGLHTVGETYGGQLVDGFAGGIQQHLGDAVRASEVVVEGAKKVFTTNLKIQSPSKVTHEYGKNTTQGFADGIKSGAGTAAAAAKKAASDATAALRDGIKAGMREALAEWARNIAGMKATISKDRSALSTWRGNRSQAAAAAKGVFTATGDLSNITGATGTTYNWDGTSTSATAPVTFADITSGLSTAAAGDKTFLADLQALKKAKVSPAIRAQILNMGPVAGDQFAKAILGTDGGASEAGQVNGLESQINQYGNEAAKQAAEPFNKHIDGLVTTIQSLTAALKKAEAAQAKAKSLSLTINAKDTDAQLKQIEAQVEKALGIKLHLKTRTG